MVKNSFVVELNFFFMKKINLSFASLILLNFIIKDIVQFLFATIAYVHDALWEGQYLLSVKCSKELNEKTISRNSEFSNPRLSQEMWFLCSIKKQLITFFGEQFKKSQENFKSIIFHSPVNSLDQIKYFKIFIAIQA